VLPRARNLAVLILASSHPRLRALAFDQELRRDPCGDDAGLLVPDIRQTDRTDQPRNPMLGAAELPRLSFESRAFGNGADQADKAEVRTAQRRRRDRIVERMRMNHDQDESTGRRGIDRARIGPHREHVGRHIIQKMIGPAIDAAH